MKILGISGTNGAGKDSVGEFLAKHGWLFLSGSEILREELRRRNLPIERHHLRELSAEWRRQYGYSVLIDKALEAHKSELHKYKGVAIASLRNPGEADEIHELSGKIIWVDADPKIRYQRIYSRQRSSEDQKTFDQFLQEEKDEMEHSGDHHTLSLVGVKAKADIFLTNNYSSLDAFLDHLDSDLKAFL